MNVFQRITPLRILAMGYIAVILIGACLLSLPIATYNGISLFDALFTSSSAACVTGLVVVDTYTTFTAFGQAVLLILIQIGGLGFMLMIVIFSMLLGRRIGLRERSLVMESISGLRIGGIVRLSKRVAICTFVFEFTGAVLLSFRFCPVYGFGRGIWMGAFHSISAFCNAGFDLFGFNGQFSSLTGLPNDPVVILTLTALILLGGLGYLVWNDLLTNRHHFKRYCLHTKIMLVTSAALVLGGTVLFLVFENGNAFNGMTPGQKLLNALFQSVTPRTAGFNAVPTDSLSESGSLLTIILMFIGGGSGSTAGGVKVTTFAVAFLTVKAFVCNKKDIEILGRRLEEVAPRKALSVIGMHLILITAGCLVLCAQQGITMKPAIFEVVSAISTVGLSMGITSLLSPFSRVIIMLFMYIGRVGSLTLAMAMYEKHSQPANIRRAEEKIVIG